MKNLNAYHLNSLRALEAVGRLGSLQAAADELGVTIGAVSQQVIKAEGQFVQPVFQRLPKRMVPAAWARPMLQRPTAGLEVLSPPVALGSVRADNIVTVSAAPVFVASFRATRVALLLRQHPTT